MSQAIKPLWSISLASVRPLLGMVSQPLPDVPCAFHRELDLLSLSASLEPRRFGTWMLNIALLRHESQAFWKMCYFLEHKALKIARYHLPLNPGANLLCRWRFSAG